MRKDIFVWLSLAMLDAVKVLRVWSDGISRAEVRKVALDVARGATTSWGGEPYV